MEGSRTPKRQILGEINNVGLNPEFSPLSPTANLKLLTKVATNVSNLSAYDQSSNALYSVEAQVDENQKSRKEKSLNLLCNKFLQLFPLNVTEGNHMIISLDEVAYKLGTERRRIYDIINVLESLQMAVKAGKNQYIWYGCQLLNVTLSQLKGLALRFGYKEKMHSLQMKQNPIEYHVLGSIHDSESESCDLSSTDSQVCANIKQTGTQFSFCKVNTQPTTPLQLQVEGIIHTKVADIETKAADPQKCEINQEDSFGQLEACLFKDERSLGVLCQKFIMLFLIADKVGELILYSYPALTIGLLRTIFQGPLPASSCQLPDFLMASVALADLINLDLAAKVLLTEKRCTNDQDKPLNCAGSELDAEKSWEPHDTNENGDSRSGKFKTKARRLYDIANVLTSLDLISKVCNAGSTRKPAFKYIGPNVEATSFSDEDLLLLQTTRQSLLGNNSLHLRLGCRLECVRLLRVSRTEDHIQIKRECSSQAPRKKKLKLPSCPEEGSSLSKILKVAEMELLRLESAKTPRKEQEIAVKTEITARKKLFPLNISESKAGTDTKDNISCSVKIDDSVNKKGKLHSPFDSLRNNIPGCKNDLSTGSGEAVLTERSQVNDRDPVSAQLKPGKEIKITRKLVKASPFKIHNLTVLPKPNTLMLSNLLYKPSNEESVKPVFRLSKELPSIIKTKGVGSTNPTTAALKQPMMTKCQLTVPASLARLPICSKSINDVPVLFISNPELLTGKPLIFKGRSSFKAKSNSMLIEEPIVDRKIDLVDLCNNTALPHVE